MKKIFKLCNNNFGIQNIPKNIVLIDEKLYISDRFGEKLKINFDKKIYSYTKSIRFEEICGFHYSAIGYSIDSGFFKIPITYKYNDISIYSVKLKSFINFVLDKNECSLVHGNRRILLNYNKIFNALNAGIDILEKEINKIQVLT